MGSWRWEVGHGKWEMVSRRWEVGGGRWEVGDGFCSMLSILIVMSGHVVRDAAGQDIDGQRAASALADGVK